MTLQQIRTKIDQLDSQVVGLLNERMRLVAEIGRLKRERGQSVFAPEREEMLLKALEDLNQGPLSKIGLRAIYREILSASRANQSRLRILYLGLEQSHNFLAARMRFGSSDCYRAEPDWKGILSSLERNEADTAVVPRQDLLEALATPSTSRAFSRSLRICGEINLIRELQADFQLPENVRYCKDPEQFFILSNGVEKQDLDGKSVFLFVLPGLRRLEGDFDDLVESHGAQVQKTASVTPEGERFLCEVAGNLQWDNFVAQAQQHWGRSANSVLLGTYPCPLPYG